MTIARKRIRKAGSESGKTGHSESSLREKKGDMPEPRGIGQQVWCPSCNKNVQVLRVSNAAKLVDVGPRTIYRYIDDGSVCAWKAAGKTLRVCKGCLLRRYPDS
jgi:excisionase family DNA binding protein